MISIKQAEIDLTNIRKYHPEIELIANTIEDMGFAVNNVAQTINIDIPSKEQLTSFLENYERLLLAYGLVEADSIPLLFLTQMAYNDIEQAKVIDNEVMEVKGNLTFLRDVLKLQENSISHWQEKAAKTNVSLPSVPRLSLKIEWMDKKGFATLENPAITNTILNQIIKLFKSPSYNYQLASYLEGVELNSETIANILIKLDYRKGSVERQCTADMAYRMLSYLNDHTSLNFDGKYASSEQCRFIYDLLRLFNLLRHIIKHEDIPRDKTKLDEFKTTLIKTLLKNHNYVPAQITRTNTLE